MAIYHFSVQIISRSQGKSSVAAAAYRAGEKIKDERTGRIYDYSFRDKVEKEILAPERAPSWVFDRKKLWNEVEKAEKRKDAQLAREINVALQGWCWSNKHLQKVYRGKSSGSRAIGLPHRCEVQTTPVLPSRVEYPSMGKRPFYWEDSLK